METAPRSSTPRFMPLLIALLLGVLLGLLLTPSPRSKAVESFPEKVMEVVGLVENEYVDDIDSDSLCDAMLNAMLLSLDPHSRYLSVNELRKEQESMQGNFDGIGVVLHYLGDTAYVGEVMADGPSVGSGLKPGDLIWCVDGDTVSGVGLSNEETVNRIRGPHGTQVTLTVLRHGEKNPLRFTIVRGRVVTPSVAYVGMMPRRTGYINLTRFGETTADEIHNALLLLKSQGMQRLVLDLRNNGGGLLEAAIAVADELLESGNMIVYTQGDHQRRTNIRSTRGGLFEQGDLIVLIDEYSASASEIVAGAVQDNDRGIIYGRRSFGKGLVQRQFDLYDGSALWLTVARYYTPSGRCIQRPYSHGSDDYYMRFLERLAAAPTTADSSYLTQPLDDSTQYYTKRKRVVYGGGGICPDKTLPYRVDGDVKDFNKLVNSGQPLRKAFEYVIHNIGSLQHDYPSEEVFLRQFCFPDLDKALPDAKQLSPVQHRRLETLMKAYVAQSLFGQKTFYKIYVTIDDDLERIELGSAAFGRQN